MAESEDGQERTEQPTQKRLQDAREKGEVPRSRELNTTVILLAGAGGLLVLGGALGEGLARSLAAGLALDRGKLFDPRHAVEMLGGQLTDAFLLLLPFVAVALVAVFIPPMVIGGFSVSPQAMVPDLKKINPIAGLKRLFGPHGLAELAKSVAKVVLIGGAAWIVIGGMLDELMVLGGLDVDRAIARSFELVGWAFLAISATMVVIAAADVPFQLWQHKRKLRMTKKEVREEAKNTEGNPEVKGRIRRVQQEVAMRRMMAEVPAADVVVTNPTHFAVALKYDEENMNAPRVVAKGADLIAAQIRTIARENNVPLFAAPPLARALYHSTELGQEIPAGLYLAVAQVLAYVYQLKVSIYGDGQAPEPPADLDVPDEFLRRAGEGRADGEREG